ncbi:hypothetical protein [Deinococcus sp.]|uniref:hypothetical protein n=1 Tax=Deinococcus sp. TaxID=47478 RepID=UPI0025C10EC2|nr:hypothetical protein [Deinococcus sp.]
MSDDTKLPTLLPTLLPHTEQGVGQEADSLLAQQGPPPADFATRPVPPTPATAGEHLSAEQVVALVGSDETASDVNRTLESVEGIDPGVTQD